MLDKSLNGVNILQRALNGCWARNKAISNNIANEDTPNYKRQDVDFESVLKNEIHGSSSMINGSITNNKHIPIGRNMEIMNGNFKIKVDTNTKYRRDGNNVDIDVETANLAKNTIEYNMIAQRLSGKFKQLKMLVRDGR